MIEFVCQLRHESLAALLAALDSARWEITDTAERRYSVWHGVLPQIGAIEELGEIWPRARWHQAFFLRVPPGGYVHRHRDTDDVYESFHIPVTSNARAVCVEHRGELQIEHHLEVGCVYSFDRTLVHSSRNDGSTERTHLIMEILK